MDNIARTISDEFVSGGQGDSYAMLAESKFINAGKIDSNRMTTDPFEPD